jgi:hypothetical protein
LLEQTQSKKQGVKKAKLWTENLFFLRKTNRICIIYSSLKKGGKKMKKLLVAMVVLALCGSVWAERSYFLVFYKVKNWKTDNVKILRPRTDDAVKALESVKAKYPDAIKIVEFVDFVKKSETTQAETNSKYCVLKFAGKRVDSLYQVKRKKKSLSFDDFKKILAIEYPDALQTVCYDGDKEV